MTSSFFQLIFDALSVYTVNHLDTVSPVVNRIIHIIFLGLLQVMFYLAYRYLEAIIEEEVGKAIRKARFTIIPLLFTMTGNIVLPVYYVESARSNYSYGPSVYMTYVGVAVYVVFIMRLMIQYGKQLPQKKKRAIYVALWSEIPVAIYQIMIPDALITCIGIVLLNIGIYMTTENPDALLAEQLAKEKRRADSANAAKTNFLANMSHEIRTPITAVLGMNELILRESKNHTIRQYAKDIEGAAKSLLSIINDILDITKIEAGKLSVISVEYDFAAVIKDVVNMISFKAKVKSLEFEVLIDKNIPQKMVGDDIRLKQILVNLLNNAVKYTHEGKITLSIYEISSACDEIEKIHFSVKDTGIGIKKEDLQKLCEPFERIEEKRNRNIEGTGLGMSITKQLLELLNSHLQVSSIYGEGSEFSFTLEQRIADKTPIGNLEEHIDADTEIYRHSYEAPKAKILMVDDNELNRKVFMGLLKSIKIQVDEAGNGKTCLEKVKNNQYDIIFMDHMMPELDGIETFRILKEMKEFRTKNIPVVILTA
ncbi:MAG: response regulator, partial [Lachnospiraceae bacterium]|nr:response regulator [Lachnospiraceae bacterium]